MGFDKKGFDEFQLTNNVVGFYEEPIELKSGRKSHFYMNWRGVMNSTKLIKRLANYVIDFANSQSMNARAFVGVPEGATKLGIVTQMELSIRRECDILPMIRASPKRHGHPKDRYFLGIPPNGVIVLEDVTTTAESLRDTIYQLFEAGIKDVKAIGLSDRSGGEAKRLLRGIDVEYSAISTALDIVPRAYERKPGSERVARAIEKEFREQGLGELVLIR